MPQFITQNKVDNIVRDVVKNLPTNLSQAELMGVISEIVCKAINAIDPKAISSSNASSLVNELKKMGLK